MKLTSRKTEIRHKVWGDQVWDQVSVQVWDQVRVKVLIQIGDQIGNRIRIKIKQLTQTHI